MSPPDVTDNAPTPPPEEPVDTKPLIMKSTESIEKPDLDERTYRHLVLHNKLQIMLVSDLSCDHAAAALDVNIGSASDPVELPGLAHFLEHMLFLGTEKYPKEDAYQNYLEQHGGSSNAFTQHEATTYFFDVQHDFLPGALDRFAQFFLCPLFTESATTREMNAVDSENSKNLQSDPWRLNQLHKWAANPKHPWSRFSTGNLQTLSDKEASHVKLEVTPAASSNGTQICLNLKSQYTPGITVRDALIKFHKEHYSANLMVLAVVGRNTLDELEQLVVPLFAKVPNHDRPAPTWSEQAYPDDRLRRHFKVVPVKDFSSLTIGWPIPPIRPQYLSKPYRYISHILGHESEGSLLSLLKEKGWADQLVAGETRSNSDFATFEVTIELTEQANEHAEEIVELVFSCLKLINSKEPIQWVHDEMHALGEVSFRFRDTVEPSSAVLSLVASLQLHPPQHALSAAFKFETFSPTEIKKLLSFLTPQRCGIIHVSHDHESSCTMREPWYGTAFTVSPIDEKLLQRCESATVHEKLHWPELNPFIPTDFALVCDTPGFKASIAGGGNGVRERPPDIHDGFCCDKSGVDPIVGIRWHLRDQDYDLCQAEYDKLSEEEKAQYDPIEPPKPDTNPLKVSPSLIREDGLAKLWHKADSTFRRPKTNLYVEIIAPAAYSAPSAACFTRLFFRLVTDELTEFAYPAECAGLAYNLSNSTMGLRLIVSGYNHKLPEMLKRVLAKVASPILDKERFIVQKDLQLKEYANFFKGQSYSLARYAHLLCTHARWHTRTHTHTTHTLLMHTLRIHTHTHT